MSSERMSALESAFLGLESRGVPFVFACILELDRPVALDALRAHVDRVLVDLPRYRQRIARGRFGRGRWIDDDQFRIDRQIFATRVPAPGGTGDELDDLAASLLATELAAERPPWRLWTVEGLTRGRGALIAIVHHSLVDGVAGIRLLERILGAPLSRPRERLAGRDRPRPRLFTWRNARSLLRLLRDGLRPADQIGLNPRRVTNDRVVATHTVELAAVKRIEDAFDVTNNDVVLATVAGALRRMLARRGVDPDAMHDVRAMVPVGRHSRHEDEAAGNRVVMLLASLPIALADPIDRLRRVAASTRKSKVMRTPAGGDLLVALGERTTPAVIAGVLRVALRLRAFNVLVTNVPGPRQRLGLLGAQLTRLAPIVNLWPHQSLAVAVASYAGALTFGVQSDREVIRDVDRFRDDLAATFAELAERASHESAA